MPAAVEAGDPDQLDPNGFEGETSVWSGSLEVLIESDDRLMERASELDDPEAEEEAAEQSSYEAALPLRGRGIGASWYGRDMVKVEVLSSTKDSRSQSDRPTRIRQAERWSTPTCEDEEEWRWMSEEDGVEKLYRMVREFQEGEEQIETPGLVVPVSMASRQSTTVDRRAGDTSLVAGVGRGEVCSGGGAGRWLKELGTGARRAREERSSRRPTWLRRVERCRLRMKKSKGEQRGERDKVKTANGEIEDGSHAERPFDPGEEGQEATKEGLV